MSVAVGVLVGWLWTVVAPEVVGVVADDGSVFVSIVAAAQVFPREGALAGLCAGAGALLAIYYSVRFRLRPVSTLMSLIGGGAAGTAVAVMVARLVGPSGAAASAVPGDQVVMPLSLDAYGLLGAWPLVAVVVVAVTAVVRDDRNPWGDSGTQPRPIGATTADVS